MSTQEKTKDVTETTQEEFDFINARVEALEKEIERLNTEIRYAKYAVEKIKETDPNFDRPLSEIFKIEVHE